MNVNVSNMGQNNIEKQVKIEAKYKLCCEISGKYEELINKSCF